jgi:hypothetical protein
MRHNGGRECDMGKTAAVLSAIFAFLVAAPLALTAQSTARDSGCYNNYYHSGMIVLFLIFLHNLVSDLLMPPDLMGSFYSGEDGVYALCEKVGEYIKCKTKENVFIYSWGHQTDIYLWSQRRALVYNIFPPVVNPPAYMRDMVAEEFSQLLANRPVYFVVTSMFGQFREFEEFVKSEYVLEQKFEPYLYLFRLKA